MGQAGFDFDKGGGMNSINNNIEVSLNTPNAVISDFALQNSLCI